MKQIAKNSIAIVLTIIILFSFNSAFSQEKHSYPLLIGDTVPAFEASTSQGIMYFPDDFESKWKIIFSHPGNFTPVCTSEFLEFALMYDEFKALDCELLGLSVDGFDSHMEWIESMENLDYKGQENILVKFPVISDINMDIAKIFGMVHPNAMSVKTIRAVYVIDPDNVVSAIVYYPQNIGRSVEEIKRLLIASQTVYNYDVITPAEWQPGDDVLLKTPYSKQEIKKHQEAVESGEINCLDWYFCFKKFDLR
jgi:peroxiredoxin (alkyl hydroperoxide reductase subunit C)